MNQIFRDSIPITLTSSQARLAQFSVRGAIRA